jgi:hypothetical protein
LVDGVVDDNVNKIPDDSNGIYLVITAPGFLSGDPPGTVGFHTSSDLVEGWVRSPSDLTFGSQSFVDEVTVTLSHELAESITDPKG